MIGGIFKNYKEYLESNWWLDKREIFLKNNPYCKDCNKEATQVHHLDYTRVPQEKESDLMSLCKSCHQKRHNNGR